MRRSCQLPDLIRLLRLKWPSVVLMQRKMQDCYWAQAFDKSAHSFRWPPTQFIHISMCSGLTPKSTPRSQLEVKLVSSTKCMILLFQTYLHSSSENSLKNVLAALCVWKYFLAHTLSTTGPILVSWLSLNIPLFCLVCSACINPIKHLTLLAYFTAHAKCFCVTQLKI